MAFEGTLQEFTVSMHGNTLEHTFIEVQQGDTASRKIRVHLKTFGGVDFLIPYGATAVLSVNKSDGHKILNECEIEDSSTVIITLTSQTIACPGMQLSQIYIFTDDWDIKTQKFYIHAPKAAYDGDAIKSTDEFGILVETLNRVKQLEEDNERINEAEEERVAAFEERIEKMDQATADANTAAGKANVAADKANAIADQIINDLTKRSNAIVQTASGESIVVNDASDDPLRGLRVFGKTEQVTTTGAQLANLPDADAYEINGVTWSCKNGIVTAKGTAFAISHSQERIRFDIADVVAGTYYVSGSANGVNVHVQVNTANDVQKWYNDGKFVLDGTEKQVRIYCQVLANTTVDTKVYPMLNKGETALPWEPYTGGTASPNPQYLQELVDKGKDGSVEVGVYGANLFDITKHKKDLETAITYNSDGSVTLTNNNNFEVGGYSQELTGLLPSGTYTISILGHETYYMTKSGDYSTLLPSGSTYTFEYDGVSYLRFQCANILSGLSRTYKYMLNTGTTALPYEPYKEPQSLPIATPNGLPGIKVTDATLANYTDSDGNIWCADEIDFERGVYVQRVKTRVFDGDETWKVHTLSTNVSVFLQEFHGAYDVILGTPRGPMSNIGYEDYRVLDAGGYGFTYAYGARLRLENMNPSNNTLDELKAYLAENPITLIYPLATPIETPLTAEELAQYQALHSNYPVTTVLNDEGVHMEVKYNADISTYIAQNYVPKSAYTELEARVLALETNAVS